MAAGALIGAGVAEATGHEWWQGALIGGALGLGIGSAADWAAMSSTEAIASTSGSVAEKTAASLVKDSPILTFGQQVATDALKILPKALPLIQQASEYWYWSKQLTLNRNFVPNNTNYMSTANVRASNDLNTTPIETEHMIKNVGRTGGSLSAEELRQMDYESWRQAGKNIMGATKDLMPGVKYTNRELWNLTIDEAIQKTIEMGTK
jgi:hypothetical protein